MLDKEVKYYNSQKKELLKQYKGKFLVIVGEEVKGDYLTEIDAYSAAIQNYELGKFLIIECTDIEEQPQVFHTRVSFV